MTYKVEIEVDNSQFETVTLINKNGDKFTYETTDVNEALTDFLRSSIKH